jgi:hypothetical protein
MPTKRRKRSNARERIEIEPELIDWILAGSGHRSPYGVDRAPCPAGFVYFNGVEYQRKAWAIVRDEVLRRWIPAYPGTRPYWFWQFDVPECETWRSMASNEEQSEYLETAGLLTKGEK